MNVRLWKLGVLWAFAVMVPAVLAHSGGPQPGHTGAPGETTCRQCHATFPLNSGGGTFTIEGVPAQYEPGQEYTITVRIAQSDRSRWGFQITALTDSLDAGGTLQVTDSQRTQIKTDDGKRYLEHRAQGTAAGTVGGTSWSFRWVAPSSDAGVVTFYAAGNAANNDNKNTGDNIYTTSAVSQGEVTSPPFEDVTGVSGLAAATGVGAAWADYDQDGDFDVFVPTAGRDLLFRNQAGVFSEIGATTGLTSTEDTRAAAWGDADNDGRPDLALATPDGVKLVKNTTSGFAETPAGLPSTSPATLVAWADFDGDGWLDLAAALDDGLALYRNDRSGSFFDVTGSTGLAGTPAPTAMFWADVDGNGYLDLVVSVAAAGRTYRQTAGTFSALDLPAGAGARDIAVLDLDGDADLDLVFAGDSGLSALRQDTSGFVDVTTALGLDEAAGSSLAVDDVDADGDTDLLVASAASLGFLARQGDIFADDTDKTGVTTAGALAATWVDYDGSGNLDLFLVSAQGGVLWRSPYTGATVTVRTRTDADGDASDAVTGTDRDALGAAVAVAPDGNFGGGAGQVLIIDGGGAAAQSPPQVLVGGPAGSIGVRASFPSADGRELTANLGGPVAVELVDGAAAVVSGVSYKLKDGVDKLLVDGAGFITGVEVIEVDGERMGETKYPKKKRLTDGTSTRLSGTDSQFGSLVPVGSPVLVTTFEPSSGLRSRPVSFTR
jgi:hypothetical protein